MNRDCRACVAHLQEINPHPLHVCSGCGRIWVDPLLPLDANFVAVFEREFGSFKPTVRPI